MRTIQAAFIFDGNKTHRNAYLTITLQGEIISLSDYAPADASIEWFNGLILPGMINSHCHLELSHLKGVIPKHTGLVDFILKINTKRNLIDSNQIQQHIEQAELEMVRNGIVAVGDICNTTDTLSIKEDKTLFYTILSKLLAYWIRMHYNDLMKRLQFFSSFKPDKIQVL